MIKKSAELDRLLMSIHKKGYPAYKDTKGVYDFGDYLLDIAHVQGDPFASPSRVNVYVKAAKHGFSQDCYKTYERRLAFCDHLLRLVHCAVNEAGSIHAGSGKSGLIAVARPGQEILERTACETDPSDGTVTVRFSIGFPAHGRTIDAIALKKILFDRLPRIIKSTLYKKSIRTDALTKALYLADDQAYIRSELPKLGLCAFIGDGSILPRKSGVSDLPLTDGVTFTAPDSLAITLNLPHHGKLRGMGVRKGITVIAGGGYHGKSTLLKALETGVYNHIAGDGREYVITDDSAAKIRAEDGRSMKDVDISLFMNHLPNGTDTRHFTTENASGSTSQAGNVMEALESGSKLLLIDEDTSATNFMIRDELMQQVIAKEKEPITTFQERIGWLTKTCDLSVILVIGSSGVYFHSADTVLQMDRYKAYDITERAKSAAKEYLAESDCTGSVPEYVPNINRSLKPNYRLKKDNRIKLKSNGTDSVILNHDIVDVRYLEQLVDSQQTVFLGQALCYMQLHVLDGKKTISQAVDTLLEQIKLRGLSSITDSSYVSSDMALARKQEIMGCLNRYRY